MGYYDHYVSRPRNATGVRAKLAQARKIFALGASPESTPGPRTILEIGPGDGYIADLAVADHCEYYAVEASATIAEALRARGFRVHQGFVPPLPPEPEVVDACFALHVIEHIPTMQAAEEFFRALGDRLRPGGALVVATPDFARWKSHFYDSDYTHVLPFTARRLRQLYAAAGLEVTYDSIYVGPWFGHGGAPLAWLASTFFTPTVDALCRRVIPGDIASRAFLTLLPNLIMVGRRPK